MISFIIPAHNEETWVRRCVAAIRKAMESVRESHEIIVVDDASTDGTGTVAREAGAQVIRVEHRHIAATRNAGAKAAQGDIFFFVDADTLVAAPVIQSALRSIQTGAVGGGCVPRFDGELPLWWRVVYPFFVVIMHCFRMSGGACLFCTRKAFAATGGFSEAHYAAEDALFIMALKQQGRVVIPAERVITSGRNLRAHSSWHITCLLVRLALRGPDGFRNRRGLDLWYRPRRGEEKSEARNSEFRIKSETENRKPSQRD